MEVDRFGNLATNLPAGFFGGCDEVECGREAGTALWNLWRCRTRGSSCC